jgi:hypothetical protein
MSTSNASVDCCCSTFCGMAHCVATLAFWTALTAACKPEWDIEHDEIVDEFNRSEAASWDENHPGYYAYVAEEDARAAIQVEGGIAFDEWEAHINAYGKKA